MTSDGELLRSYAESNSESAFAELVGRHLDLVYSAALRQVNGDAHLAQDVAQTVFADLARKSASLAHRSVLTGWLYTSTHFAAAKAIRAEQRRHKREEEAHAMNQLLCDSATDLDWEKVHPVLDTAMLELNEVDREAVLLRYFDNRAHAEIAERLGLSENAARMRVDRALEKLRVLLVRRGVSTTAALSTVISANAVSVAPAGLAATLWTALSGTTFATTATATKAIAMTTLQKTIIGATLIAAVGTGIYEARQVSTLRTQVRSLQPLGEQVQQLQSERADAARQLAALREENERLNRDIAELPRLRGELGRLRQTEGRVAALEQERIRALAQTAGDSTPPDAGTPQLSMRVFSADTRRLLENPSQQVLARENETVVTKFLSFLEQNGVKIESPTRIVFDERTTQFIVHDTATNLDAIERLLTSLNAGK